MDYEKAKAQIEASRRLEHTVDGVTFQVTLPTSYAVRVFLDAHRDVYGRRDFVRSARDVVNAAVIGWTGLTLRHFIPEGPPETVDFSPEARTDLIETRQDIADVLSDWILSRCAERNEKLEAAVKN